MRAIVTATEQLIEHWTNEMMAEGYAEGFAQGRAEGRIEARIEALICIHEARFGPMPARMKKALAAKVTVDTGPSWVTLFVTAASAGEIAAAIREGLPAH